MFPDADKKMSGSEWSDCAKQGLAVKTFKGDALMFYSLKPMAAMIPQRGSCPTTQGNKWSATKWIHAGQAHPRPVSVGRCGRCGEETGTFCCRRHNTPYVWLPPKPQAKPGDCVDDHEQCTE